MAVSLQTRVFYGLRTDIANNVHYITDAEVLYPVGNALAIHNILQHQQKLIRLPERYYDANGICVSINKKFVALSDVGDKPTISIYDLNSLKRRKLLGIPFDAPGVTRFTCISFTFDSKYLVAITGEPDQTMLFYNWEKGKVESTFKLANPQNPLAIAEVLACNPTDATVVAVGGAYTFKFLTVSETVWRPYGFAKSENLLVCSMTWLDGDRLMVGTEDGRMLYLENGDLKNVYRMTDTVTMNLKIREEYVMPIAVSSQIILEAGKDDTWQQNVGCLIAFPRGFAYAHGGGTVVLFEKEGKHKYTKRNVYVIPQRMMKDDDPNLYKIHTINVNPSFDRLIVTTDWSQMYYATLWGPDLQMDPEPQEMKIMGQPLHHGPINGLSMCAWKPVFMTCGEFDHSVRLWDFETESLIMLKQYDEDISSVALHPMGLFCLIGFTDKLRFMSILIDDLLPMHEIAIRNCKTVRFSHNGHLFAAVNGNVIQVYTTIGFYNPFILKGHTGKVKTLLWSQTDLKILSMGAEGSIYEWNMTTGTRSSEFIWKNIVLHDIVLSSDASFIYCITQDDQIREIKENEIVREFRLPGKEMQQMIMGKNDLTLFITSPSGIIISLKSPLQTPIESTDFHIHCVDITQIALSYNENCLISVAKDGSLCIWKLYFPEGKIMKMSRDLPYTNEVLIGKGDLEEKIHSIKNLTVRLRELEMEHAYRLRQIDVQHNDKLREVHQGYCEAIEELVEKVDKDREDHRNEVNNMNMNIVRMKASHEEVMKQMENNYEAKLITEYDKYQAFEERTNAMRENYEKQLKDLEKRDAEQLQKTVTKYEALLHEKKIQLEETFDEMTHKERVHERLMAQIEDDTDREILEIRTKYENLIYDEKQISLKLKGEAGVIGNKFMASQRDVDDLKRQVDRVQGEYAQFHKNIQDLEKQITDLKKEITERDATIRNKEQQIYDMKRTNQELEKFKFVLNFKIDELMNQIQPKNQEIQELKDSIRNMEEELMSIHKTNENLELQLHEEREKLRIARRETDREIHKNKRCQQLLRKIRVDILDISELVQEPNALKTAVTNLYHKYSADDETLRSRKADMDAQCEFIRQKDQLEKTIASLKKQVFQDTSTGDKELRMTEENSMLTVELNALREELKQAREHVLYMESLLGLTRKDVRPTEARKILEQAFHGYQELQEKYMKQIQEYQQVILALKEDIKQLLNKIPCEEKEEEKTSS
ncbi:PREDICTED: cilia- and flagella-associated protein 57 [Trachymyrmex cornetzi]|uniref:WD repeat-containing protein 65 n=1 Tax=Trachymyrmex cornetzi TaxID=471704 RepID=A0A195DRZ0_9HYME|nr:PREDICTED: cilia- and flagella-associated protein 57 [Trachymyrmex cornetzi]KYN15284.1 WD repeat-containing protein 65 [Trachymyrmex cornetzi]